MDEPVYSDPPGAPDWIKRENGYREISGGDGSHLDFTPRHDKEHGPLGRLKFHSAYLKAAIQDCARNNVSPRNLATAIDGHIRSLIEFFEHDQLGDTYEGKEVFEEMFRSLLGTRLEQVQSYMESK